MGNVHSNFNFSALLVLKLTASLYERMDIQTGWRTKE